MSTVFSGLELHASYDWRFMAKFRFKRASQSLSDKPFVCTYMHNLKTTGRVWTFCISNNIKLHEISDCKGTAADTHWSFSDTILCAYVHVHRYCHANTHDNKNHIPCIWLHTKRWLYSKERCIVFVRTKLASYNTRCSAFSINRVLP